MDFLTLFPSKYLAAADLRGQDRVVQVSKIVGAEEVGQAKEKRPVLYFSGVEKGMVLNKTNAKRIAKLYGNNTDGWIGKSVTLYPSECDFRDEVVPCLRVRDSMPVAPVTPAIESAAGVTSQLSPEQISLLLANLAVQKPTT